MKDKLATVVESYKPLVESMKRTNQVMVGQLEKWSALQMESMKAYVDLGLAQVKVALKVTDPCSLDEFMDSQFAVLSFVGHRMADDSRALADWRHSCFAQTHCLTRANMLGMLFKY